MFPIGHHSREFILNRRPTEPEERVKLWSEGKIQHDAWYWRRLRRNPPLGYLSLLWLSVSTLREPFCPDGNLFCWCPRVWCNIPGFSWYWSSNSLCSLIALICCYGYDMEDVNSLQKVSDCNLPWYPQAFRFSYAWNSSWLSISDGERKMYCLTRWSFSTRSNQEVHCIMFELNCCQSYYPKVRISLIFLAHKQSWQTARSFREKYSRSQ